MRQLSSGIKNSFLINALRLAPAELRTFVSHLITDKIYWRIEGSTKIYTFNDITLTSQPLNQTFQLTFHRANETLFNTTIEKWPDNWHDEEIGRDKMKM